MIGFLLSILTPLNVTEESVTRGLKLVLCHMRSAGCLDREVLRYAVPVNYPIRIKYNVACYYKRDCIKSRSSLSGWIFYLACIGVKAKKYQDTKQQSS